MLQIAHIDHGKSTLADRMLEFAGNLSFAEVRDTRGFIVVFLCVDFDDCDRVDEFTPRLPCYLTRATSDQKNKQVLDFLEVEKERGITVKAQTASMFYRHESLIAGQAGTDVDLLSSTGPEFSFMCNSNQLGLCALMDWFIRHPFRRRLFAQFDRHPWARGFFLRSFPFVGCVPRSIVVGGRHPRHSSTNISQFLPCTRG